VLVIAALTFGLKNRVDKHRKVVRFALPIWLYVSVTGVIVYLMLYRPFIGVAHADPRPELITGHDHIYTVTEPGGLPVAGPEVAPITLEVCIIPGGPPAASATAAVARKVQLRNADVRLMLHLYAGWGASQTVGELLLEAASQGRMWQLFDVLMQSPNPAVTRGDIDRLVSEAHLDPVAVAEALETHRHRVALETLYRSSRAAQLAPGQIFVNRRPAPGGGNEVRLADAVAAARREADALLARGVPLAHLYEELGAIAEPGFSPDPIARRLPRRRMRVALDDTPTRGAPGAAIDVVLFGDLSSSMTRDAVRTLLTLERQFEGQVRIHHKTCVKTANASDITSYAAELGFAAQEEGRFFELVDALAAITPLGAGARGSAGTLADAAHAAGIDLARFDADRARGRYRVRLERAVAECRALGVPYAPSVIIGGYAIAGASPDVLERTLRIELDRGVVSRLQDR
jgi:protein-disulfide isomerase